MMYVNHKKYSIVKITTIFFCWLGLRSDQTKKKRCYFAPSIRTTEVLSNLLTDLSEKIHLNACGITWLD